MIRAGFFRDCDGYRVVVEGHSGYAQAGQDIVCAAVSGIFFALAGYLKNTPGGCDIISIRSGFAELACPRGSEEALKMACIGMIQVGELYPECVTVCNKIF